VQVLVKKLTPPDEQSKITPFGTKRVQLIAEFSYVWRMYVCLDVGALFCKMLKDSFFYYYYFAYSIVAAGSSYLFIG